MFLSPAPSDSPRDNHPFVAANRSGQTQSAQRVDPHGELGGEGIATGPLFMDRNEELFFRNLTFLKDLRQANTSEKLAVMNGDTGLGLGVFPKGASVSVAYSDGGLRGMTMEVFFHPGVTFAPQPTNVARALAVALLGQEYARVSLVKGAGVRGVTSMVSELQNMLGSSEPLPNLQRLARQSLTLGNSVVVLPQDAPFPLVRAALEAFLIVVAPRGSFDDEVGDHLQILVAAGALQQEGLKGLQRFHAGLVEIVGDRPSSAMCSKKQESAPRRAKLRDTPEPRNSGRSLQTSRGRREGLPMVTGGGSDGQRERSSASAPQQLSQDPSERKREADRIAELEKALRASGQLL